MIAFFNMENKVIVDEAKFKELKDKVVVLTGQKNYSPKQHSRADPKK